MDKNLSARKTPVFQGLTPLVFDNFTEDEVLQLADDEEGTYFLSRWLEAAHPFTAYAPYFKESEWPQERILRAVRLNFLKACLQEGWSERKYVLVLDQLFTFKRALLWKEVAKAGVLHDEGRLHSQLLAKRLQGRKRL